MSRMLIAGNWKMNGKGTEAKELASAIRQGGDIGNCEYLICPPFTSLSAASDLLSGSSVSLGAQDCHAAGSGAHTGDISVDMLVEIGCAYVIVGHSERRTDHNESNSDVSAKAAAAHGANLTAIICVGESDQIREAGDALSTVESQIVESLPSTANSTNTVIAYEPIWAIGTGKVPTLEQISEMHVHIQSVLMREMNDPKAGETRLLYGGSVNAENAADILRCDGVCGALVGGASLKAESFLAIGQSCP